MSTLSNPNKLNGKIAFVISGMNGNNIISVSVTPLDYFQTKNAQADWTPSEVYSELGRLGYRGGESEEGTVELDMEGTDESVSTLRNKLLASDLFLEDAGFTAFMKSFESEEFIVIDWDTNPMIDRLTP